MKTLQTKLWWVWAPLVFTLQIHAQSDWTDKSPHKSGFITANGVKLHYLNWGGKGDTMLFLHGIGDMAHTFDDFAPKFTNQFRVLGLTRRGHGESEVPDSGYDTATRVEDIRQFLDALNISRVVLVGFSAAGGEVTMFAGKHPDRTIKAVYLDAIFDVEGQVAMRRRGDGVLREMQAFLADSEWSDRSPHKSGFITVNGVRLHYLDWGGNGDTPIGKRGVPVEIDLVRRVVPAPSALAVRGSFSRREKPSRQGECDLVPDAGGPDR